MYSSRNKSVDGLGKLALQNFNSFTGGKKTGGN